MFYVFLTALAISGLDVFLSLWKAMLLGALLMVGLYVHGATRPAMTTLKRVPTSRTE